jgi:hypothetical protein
MYGAMNFQGCTAYLNPNHCAPGNVPAGEAMRGFSAGFLLSPTSLNKASGDTVYNSFWAKPGYKSPIGLNGPCAPYVHCYLYAANDVLDSDGGGFMLTAANAQMNKWQGFYWGYGFGFSWPVVRLTTTGPARVPAGIKVSGSATMSGQQRQQAR